MVTNSSGNVVGEQRYYPFGETRLSTGQLFTGQREMTGLGIYHFNARFYSPKLGRFISADSIVPNPANPQDLNRYSYVRNNPLRYTDPTGNRPCGDGEKYDCDGRLNPTTPPAPKPPVVIVPNPKPEKGDPHDPIDAVDTGPIAAPYSGPIVTSTGTPGSENINVPQFVGDAILIVGGMGFIALGFAMIGLAVVETEVVIVIPSPIDDLLTLGGVGA